MRRFTKSSLLLSSILCFNFVVSAAPTEERCVEKAIKYATDWDYVYEYRNSCQYGLDIEYVDVYGHVWRASGYDENLTRWSEESSSSCPSENYIEVVHNNLNTGTYSVRNELVPLESSHLEKRVKERIPTEWNTVYEWRFEFNNFACVP